MKEEKDWRKENEKGKWETRGKVRNTEEEMKER